MSYETKSNHIHNFANLVYSNNDVGWGIMHEILVYNEKNNPLQWWAFANLVDTMKEDSIKESNKENLRMQKNTSTTYQQLRIFLTFF